MDRYNGLNHWQIGLHVMDFPACCAWQFDQDCTASHRVYSGMERGCVHKVREDGTLSTYVPCSDCVREERFEGIRHNPGVIDACVDLQHQYPGRDIPEHWKEYRREFYK